MARTILTVVALASCLCQGCIETDSHFSFYLQPDGKVDGVAFIDNVRSTAETPEARAVEEQEWIDAFRKAESDEIKQLRDSGATGIDTKLLRETAPYAAVVRWTFADIEGLAVSFGAKREEGEFDFHKSGARRMLAFHLKAPKANKAAGSKSAKPLPLPERTIKFVPVGGRLVKTTHCTADAAKSFCVVDFKELYRLDREGKNLDVMIEWEVLSPRHRG